jgi:hypothetical protein
VSGIDCNGRAENELKATNTATAAVDKGIMRTDPA